MTAGATRLDLIGERTSSERAPAVRAFAEAYLRRLSADGADGTLAPDELLRRDRRRLRVRHRARRRADRRARLQPDARRATATSAPGSVLETNTDDSPFLVDTVRADARSRAASASAASCTRSSASSATPTARIAAVLHAREALARASRSCTSSSSGG